MLPSLTISSMMRSSSCTISGASPSSGSSSSSSLGLVISARPIASICCSPPESWLPMFARRSSSRGNVAYTRSRFHDPGRADDRQVLLDA